MKMLKRFDLHGKSAVVTGGSTGLGLAMADALLQSGARVLIAGRQADALDIAAKDLREAVEGAEFLFDTVDLYDRPSITAFADRTLRQLGNVDIFIGNAGAVHAEQLGAITLDEVDRVLQLNLTSNIQLTQAFLPGMKERHWGRVIYSSSTSAMLAAPFQGNLTYAATKSGINGFMRVIAAELGRSGITVNAIVFGVFWTSILRNALQQLREQAGATAADELIDGFTEMTAIGRLGEAEDLHGLVQLLASDAGGYITGASIPLEGGTSVMMRAWPRDG